MSVVDQILSQITALPSADKQLLLQRLSTGLESRPAGVPGSAFLSGFDPIDELAAKEMISAIEAECEQVDAREW